ncbi:hypothetical protein J4402_03925 [Candidatus Pacearchaeota archaeon]|nr:hypothetical protein [Candidatus Pacearchaeota archaeon]
MNKYENRCEFYDDKRCPYTRKCLDGKTNKDLLDQRENLCSRVKPDCPKRTTLLDLCLETL